MFGACGDGFHDAIEVKASGFLAGRKFFEALEPLPDVSARGSDDKHVI